jgi:hypothetical protein
LHHPASLSLTTFTDHPSESHQDQPRPREPCSQHHRWCTTGSRLLGALRVRTCTLLDFLLGHPLGTDTRLRSLVRHRMLAARRSQLQAMEDRQQYRPQGWSASRGLETAGKSQCYSCQSCGGIDLHRAKHSHVPTANFRSHIEPHPSCAFSEGEAGVQRRFTFQPRCRLKSPWESFESGHGRLRHLSQILSSTHLPWRLDKYQPTRHTSFGSEKHAGGWHRPLSSTSHPTNRPLRCARVILAQPQRRALRFASFHASAKAHDHQEASKPQESLSSNVRRRQRDRGGQRQLLQVVTG